MGMQARRVAVIAITFGFAGCLLPAYEVDESLGNGGSGGSLPDLLPAPQDCGPNSNMVPIPGGYCVDATEVTWEEYSGWQATLSDPPVLDQPAECSWNDSAAPKEGTMGCEQPPESGRPVVCIDWCDAHAYCRAKGKRLCGEIGGDTLAWQDYANPGASQWMNACTSGGRNEFPYGTAYDASKCHTLGIPNAQPRPVGGAACQSSVDGYGGIFDLSGNVAEWVAECERSQGAGDRCRIRGGSFDDKEEFASCDDDSFIVRDSRLIQVGFRCCWDPPT